MARPDAKSWHQAVVGGALVALGSVIVGATRNRKAAAEDAAPVPRPASRSPSRLQTSDATMKPRPHEGPRRTRYWPPPAPPPIEGSPEHDAAEAAAREDHLPVDAESEKLGYEVEDTRAGHLARVMAFSTAVIACSVAALFYMIGHYHRVDGRSSPLTPQQSAVIVPPGPRLQGHPLYDIAMEKKREAELLLYYGWADPSHRVARIPIARAEALVIGRPLDPLPPETGAAPSVPTPAPNP